MRDGRKKFLIVASGLIAGILGAHFILDPGDSSRPLETPADTENQPPVSQPLAQHLASRPMTAPPGRAELPPRRAPKPAYRPKPAQAPSTGKPADAPKGLVEFEVIDGDAVAFGDVLLGKPDAGPEVKSGYAEPPVPLLWEKPQIPYVISPDLPNPGRIQKAFDYFAKHTPVTFVPYQGQKDAIVFQVGTQHCYSYLGRVGGLQPLKLAAGCQSQEIIHELMHARGFVHEQSRPDRDQYVEIVWNNIEEKYKEQFMVVPEFFSETSRGAPFDYRSVMMYEPTAFALQPGLITLKSLNSQPISPIHDGLSEGDLKRVNHLFGLPD